MIFTAFSLESYAFKPYHLIFPIMVFSKAQYVARLDREEEERKRRMFLVYPMYNPVSYAPQFLLLGVSQFGEIFVVAREKKWVKSQKFFFFFWEHKGFPGRPKWIHVFAICKTLKSASKNSHNNPR